MATFGSVFSDRGILPIAILLFISLTFPVTSRGENFNGRIIHLHNVKETFYTAYETCHSEKMDLLTIQNDTETELMLKLLKDRQLEIIWLGATDLGHHGDWVWTSSGKKITYIPWGTDQPNNVDNDQHCMGLSPNENGWIDYFCHHKLNYFCEEKQATKREAIPVQLFLMDRLK